MPLPRDREGADSLCACPASERGQQADDDREQHGALDQGGGDDHRRADLAGRLGLAGDRLDRAAADAADAEAAAEQGEAGAERAAQLAGAVGGQQAAVMAAVGRRRRAAPRLRRGPGPTAANISTKPKAIIINASLAVLLLIEKDPFLGSVRPLASLADRVVMDVRSVRLRPRGMVVVVMEHDRLADEEGGQERENERLQKARRRSPAG